jgi:hypothetical protein
MFLTIIPYHKFVSRKPWCFSSTNNRKNIRFMYHLYDSNSSTKLPTNLFLYLCSKFKNFEAFLSADCEIRLILIKGNMNDFLFVLFHMIVLLPFFYNLIIKSSIKMLSILRHNEISQRSIIKIIGKITQIGNNNKNRL